MNISPDGTGLAVLGLGFALGVRHALDPDHLVAVSTIVSTNKSVARSSIAGAFWGLGHTASLFICGTIVLALRLSIPENFVATAEKMVAGMLVLLGINALWRAMKNSRLHVHFHTHDGRRHIHFHVHKPEESAPHDHRHRLEMGLRSFLIGMVHGLAGTGALMILVIAAAPSFIAGSLYILIFGLGSIGGMLILSSVISIPFVLSARFFHVFNHGLQFVTALLSIALGLFWISPI
jgi:ABC-type nickel/cobalt efflux system permease component RcnA